MKAARRGAWGQGGENHPNCKISEIQIEQMRDMRERKFKYSDIASVFGISTSQAWKILNGASR